MTTPLPLPPLTALRAFEAAARCGSYVAAAREIGVTPTAISQHIRTLEAFLGKQLFTRFNNRIVLTDAGQVMFEGAHAGLQIISQTAQHNQMVRRPSRVVISCIESIAETWLVPRLAAYAARHANFRFDLRVEPDPVEWIEHGADLRLAYDPAHYPGHTMLLLGADAVQPLCSPAWLERHPALRADGMAAAFAEDLLHVDWGPGFGSRPGWAQWFLQAGLAAPDMAQGSQAGSSAMALDLARHGLGIVLGGRMMAGADLHRGTLVALSPVSVSLARAYALVYPRDERRKQHVTGLATWLEQQWRASD